MKKEIVDLIELYLTNEGYEVTKCYNGTDALNVIEKNDVDLELLDLIILTVKVEDTDKIAA